MLVVISKLYHGLVLHSAFWGEWVGIIPLSRVFLFSSLLFSSWYTLIPLMLEGFISDSQVTVITRSYTKHVTFHTTFGAVIRMIQFPRNISIHEAYPCLKGSSAITELYVKINTQRIFMKDVRMLKVIYRHNCRCNTIIRVCNTAVLRQWVIDCFCCWLSYSRVRYWTRFDARWFINLSTFHTSVICDFVTNSKNKSRPGIELTLQ